MILNTSRTSLHRRAAMALVGAALAASLVTPSVFAVAGPSAAAAPVEAAAVTYPYAPWLTDEAFYLKMVNCTRTGGWVQSNGSCTAYGSGRYSAYVKPLVRSGALSDKVTRPYAKILAVKSLCGHNYDGSLTTRLTRGGYTGLSSWGENLACHSGLSTRAMVIWAHRVFQAEKSSNGGHWKNIKNARHTYIGIGVWRYGTRVRLVTDFYRP